ncbi:hypothetical protein GCM10009001_31060 [Virgibacillus siamensis]|uniref:Uncharacterized protein n=1 Tax=Virgibacillus siamensis TaxID=480071 RepID=A0ABP3RJK0_9BACI
MLTIQREIIYSILISMFWYNCLLENLVVTKPLDDSLSCTYAVRKFYTFLFANNKQLFYYKINNDRDTYERGQTSNGQ